MTAAFPAIFLSYSRRELPFVNQLDAKLEEAGVSLWLDYQSLVPAQPWAGQIESGICNAEVFVLVVSHESLASRYVEMEWKRAVELGKRVVLVIFQATPLPPELLGREWVDLRVHFNGGVKKLLQLLKAPEPPPGPPPQTGLSALLIPAALYSSWTLVLPYLLVPLPWQIYQRRFNLFQVRFALFSLPLFVLLTGVVIDPNRNGTLDGLLILMLLPALSLNFILLALLSSNAFDRWGRPEAARVRFAHPLDPQVKEIRPVTFAIEHAVEDGRYAEAIRGTLEKAGHRLAVEGEPAEASFVLISTFQTTTRFDPERQIVYPVLLQTVEELTPALSRIQWIDFRSGLHNLRKLAQLLPEPQRLLNALAVTPSGNQAVYPSVVAFLLSYAVVSGVMTGGSLLVVFFDQLEKIVGQGLTISLASGIAGSLLNGMTLGLLLFWAVRALSTRRGGAAAIYPLLIMYLFQMLTILLVTARGWVSSGQPSPDTDSGMMASVFNLGTFLGGGTLALLVILFRWQDLWRWLPRRPAGGLHPFERLFLLYTPPGLGTLSLHFGFHSLFLLIFFSLNGLLDTTVRLDADLIWFLALLLLMAGAANLWARYMDRACS